MERRLAEGSDIARLLAAPGITASNKKLLIISKGHYCLLLVARMNTFVASDDRFWLQVLMAV